MRDRRHIMIECYLGQLAPPRLRLNWRGTLWRFDRILGRGYRVTVLSLLMVVPGLCISLAWLLSTRESPWAEPVGMAAATVVPIVSVAVLLVAWPVMRRRMSLQARFMRRWRLGDAQILEPRGNGGPDELAWEEIEKRTRFWRWRVRRPLDAGRVFDAGVKRAWLVCYIWVSVSLSVSVSVANEIGIVGMQSVLIVPIYVLVLYIGLFVWVYEPIRLRRRLLRSWSDCRCPACRHDLQGLGKPPCPSRCPECGFPWPMLPPPAYSAKDLKGEDRVFILWRNPADAPPTAEEAGEPLES